MHAFYGDLAAMHSNAIKKVERRIAALEKRLGQQAVDKSYLSGFTVKDGKTYLQVRIVFRLKLKLQAVK